MARLDTDRQNKLEPERMAYAKAKLQGMGITIEYEDVRQIKFKHRGETVTFFPYSGWFTGKTVITGRGFSKLYNQLNK